MTNANANFRKVQSLYSQVKQGKTKNKNKKTGKQTKTKTKKNQP